MKINFLQFRSVFRLSVFAIHLAMSGLLISCEPEPTPVDADVKAGNTTNLFVINWDTVISPMNNVSIAEFSLDIDGDGHNDIKFEAYETYWHGATGAQTKIYCLDTAFCIAAINYYDTIFFSKTYDTTLQNGIVYIWELSRNSCERYSSNDIVTDTILNPRVHLYFPGEIVTSYEHWMSDTLSVSFRGFGVIPLEQTVTQDTIYNYGAIGKYDCHNLPNDSIVLMGVRKNINGTYKYGWLRFRISDNHIIELFESAIER